MLVKSYESSIKRTKNSLWKIVASGLVLVAMILVAILALFANPASDDATPVLDSSAVEQTTVKEPPIPKFNAESLQLMLTDWVATHEGTYGITLADDKGKILAESGGDTRFFTASIYKLYVAYMGYQKIDDGTHLLEQSYWNGWTRGECLDEMIRTSNSPCAEKLWNELGKEATTAKLKEYGLTDTSMTGLYTSSRDAAIILARLQQGLDLSQDSRTAMLKSMEAQIYRKALPVGFATAIVRDKVGFNEKIEYHDTALVEFADGRVMVVSVLSKNAGTGNVIKLAQTIEQAIAN